MEEVIVDDFENWLSNFKLEPTKYVAVFDPISGKVISVGPDHAFKEEIHCIPIDTDIAESIINGDLLLEKCMVNPDSNNLEISEIKTLVKLDNVLHRIISAEYSEIKNPDIYITYFSNDKTLKIELSEKYGGTKKLVDEVKKRNFVWDDRFAEMNFYITDYNDPNLIYEIIYVKINDLIGNDIIFKNIDYDNFSVYTKRLFKNYIIEYK